MAIEGFDVSLVSLESFCFLRQAAVLLPPRDLGGRIRGLFLMTLVVSLRIAVNMDPDFQVKGADICCDFWVSQRVEPHKSQLF